MLDQGVAPSESAGEFIDLHPAGVSAAGEFQCAACGYGVSVQSRLPACPMCAGEVWVPKPWTPLTRAIAWRV